MKNYKIITIVVLLLIGLVFVFSSKKGGLGLTKTTTTENKKSSDIFKNMTDMCSVLTKNNVESFLGKQIVKVTPVTTNTIHSCQYYLENGQAIIVNIDNANVEDQKKTSEFLGFTIKTNSEIPGENYSILQDDGKINRLLLVINPNEYLSINRTSAQTLTESEMISFAQKLAGVITGKILLTKSSLTNTPVPKEVIPLPQETDIIHTFFNLIEEKRPSDAVGMMNVSDDSQKQAWAVQFNAISSMKVLNIEPSTQEEWTDAKHTYKVTMDVKMNPNSANQPISYYGWENGNNTKWITIEKIGNIWKINGIATGP